MMLQRLGHAAPIAALAVVLFLGTAPAAPAPVAAPKAGLTSVQQAKLAVRTAPLEAMSWAPGATGYARVIDPVPLATLEAELTAALAAAGASRAEASRARILASEDQLVAAKAAEAAAAQATADQSRVTLLRTRLGLEWGPALAALGDGQRRALVASLARGDAALLRIDGPNTPLSGTVTLDLGPNGLVPARVLGAARTADVRLQSSGSLALASGSQARRLATGLVVPVRLPAGAGSAGVFVPDSAVLRAEGESWVYVQTAPDAFERRALGAVAAVDQGLFAGSGVRPGEIVATRGASALYAAELAGS